MQATTQRVRVDLPQRYAIRLGFWDGALTAVSAAVALAAGVLTPARGGPFCQSGCVAYPYTDVATFVPGDYLWMYPAALMMLAAVLLLACVYEYVSEQRRIFGLIALAFAIISATAITIDYVIQLAVVQPSLLSGETAGLTLFSMYNPHGVFLALEDLGYLMLSISLLFCGLALAGQSGLERAVRWLFAAAATITVGALVVLAAFSRENLVSGFEIAAITINWTALIAGGILLSLIFRRAARRMTSG